MLLAHVHIYCVFLYLMIWTTSYHYLLKSHIKNPIHIVLLQIVYIWEVQIRFQKCFKLPSFQKLELGWRHAETHQWGNPFTFFLPCFITLSRLPKWPLLAPSAPPSTSHNSFQWLSPFTSSQSKSPTERCFGTQSCPQFSHIVCLSHKSSGQGE